MSEPIFIEPGETELLIASEDTDEYYGYVFGTTVYLGRSRGEAKKQNRPAPAGDRGPMGSEPGEAVYGYVPKSATETARVQMDHNGFWFEREARSVVGGVLTSSEDEASPANDEFAHYYGIGADPSAGISHSFRAPDAADSVVVSVDGADNTFEVAVVFEDADGNELTRRDSGNSSAYSGSSTSDVFVTTEIASEFVKVEITGSATSADYTVYAR